MRKYFLIITSSIVLFLILGAAIFLISRSLSFQFFGEIYPNVVTSKKVIALTFDDGPSVKTDSILKILEDNKVKATFFLNGNKIENNFKETQRIVLSGNEIGNHSYSHNRLLFKSKRHIKDQIVRTDSLIRLAGYSHPIHFRPPYGKKFLMLPLYLKSDNRKTIMWDIDPESYADIASDSDKIADYVVQNSKNGSIILLHVMFREPSLKSVAVIIKKLKEEGYEFKTVSELLEFNE
ncbi:Peptidoglycan/xylan/chitin deacetylase, PgdA/CDA1 family [Arenibacter nanhaiticus]|uniref:Peptidoglycan/xylan/chitin deacetylase, PgdA/CDA1 family n=1 Tax=Arenibacter nanhaiticus TaxID=558155 RepID=A0A1M6MPT4_9FLAO|nr:polysaccharide deacetylase family protein [Arenibacter nanhaiticus]SHJ85477.1 Peptidoglycan/xylan/chitin deacetylase, PgdA/CDA1 family [Arenibacter nanhaiticus]